MLDENSQYESVLGITHDYKYGVSLAVCKNMANTKRRHGVVVLRDEEGFIAYQAAYSQKINSTIIVPKNGHTLDSLSERSQSMIISTLNISDDAIGKFNT